MRRKGRKVNCPPLIRGGYNSDPKNEMPYSLEMGEGFVEILRELLLDGSKDNYPVHRRMFVLLLEEILKKGEEGES